MTTLTAFLLARITEDEDEAREAAPGDGVWFSRYPDQPDCHMYGDYGWIVSGPSVETDDTEWGKSVADHIARHDPARVLAECSVKRRIVQEADAMPPSDGGYPDGWGDAIARVVRLLALPYADHPDYDPKWRW